MRLVQGNVPGIHHRDYLSDSDAKRLGVSRPHLKTCKSNTREPLTLCVNILLNDTTSKRTIETLTEICSQHQWVDVKLKGVNLLGLNSAVLKKFHLAFNTLISPITDCVYSTKSCFRYLLLYSAEQSENLAATLSQLIIEPCRLRAFCLLQTNADISDVLSSSLSTFLVHSCEYLEYLQLQYWSLTLISLDALLQCSRLRVISISEAWRLSKLFRSRHSVEDVLTAVSQLPHLEFFQWCETINFTTAGLLCLHNLLNDSFKSLQHFHINFMYVLLSTTDLVNITFSVLSDILIPLLNGKEGSEEVTTFRFAFEGIVDILLDWLFKLRSNVCFKLGQQVSHATELVFFGV